MAAAAVAASVGGEGGRPYLQYGKLSVEPRLPGHVCIVSGASRGFGQAIAVRFLEEGASVVMLARSSMAETLGLMNKVAGVTPEYVAAHTLCLATDSESEADCAKAAADTVARFGPVIHCLVNNAALFVFHSVETASAEDWDRSAAVNIKGHALLTKAVLPHMKGIPGSGGSIIFQGSISSFLAQPNCATYATMKGALVQLARNCAYDFACVSGGGPGGPLSGARPAPCATSLSLFTPPCPAPCHARAQQVQHPRELCVRRHHRDAHLCRRAQGARVDVRPVGEAQGAGRHAGARGQHARDCQCHPVLCLPRVLLLHCHAPHGGACANSRARTLPSLLLLTLFSLPLRSAHPPLHAQDGGQTPCTVMEH